MADGDRRYSVSHAGAAHLAHGWFMRVQRSVDAILLLGRHGAADIVPPLSRSVIEHCLALRWFAAEGDKVLDAIGRGHREVTARQLTAVAEAGWTSVSQTDLQAVVDEIDALGLDSSTDHLLQFRARCDAYGDGNELPEYYATTMRSHPTHQSAATYCLPPSESESGRLVLLSGPREPGLPQLPFATTHLLEALLMVRELFDPRPWRNELVDGLASFRAVTDAVRAQNGLPPAEWGDFQVPS
ncbi:MAG TPA: DUF5677 domain-containing protein [Mycobacteriales bacterium]|nr:DUF5677 domain-containing protein [Mycobacteriales bacterium]